MAVAVIAKVTTERSLNCFYHWPVVEFSLFRARRQGAIDFLNGGGRCVGGAPRPWPVSCSTLAVEECPAKVIAKLRYMVEQDFGTMKRRFHLTRLRYFGAAKTQPGMVSVALGLTLSKAMRRLQSAWTPPALAGAHFAGPTG
ncbi:MAG: hypothetical protein KBC73_17795 [Burkholderiaceae bacterium]|nr:hypothetical protein [Burkholderiaceae bacterium]